jgi:ankyrin repeat protein
VKVLLAFGADPDQRLTWRSVDWTPLALAVTTRDSEIVDTLLNYGADPNLWWCVPVLLVNNFVCSKPTGCSEENGRSPLMAAAASTDGNAARMLLSYGADHTLRDWQGRTALGYAVRAKNEEAINALTEIATRRPRP